MVWVILILLVAGATPGVAIAQQQPNLWFNPNTVPRLLTDVQRPQARAHAPGSYEAGPTPKLNPCAGISSDAIVAMVNARGGLRLGPEGARFRAVTAFGLQSTTAGFGPGYAGVCTGYLTVIQDGGRGMAGVRFNVELRPDGTIWFWPLAALN
jgi:hypothetical protein